MYARQTTLQGDPSKLDDFLQFFREQTPTIRQQGARGVRLLADRRSGKVQIIALWESREAADAAEATISPLRSQGAQRLGVTGAPTIELFEVLVLEDF